MTGLDIAIIVGTDVVLTVCSFFAGLRVGRTSAATPKMVLPICTCDHGRSMHKDKGSGACVGQNYVRVRGFMEWVPCRCLHYVGPLPVMELWTPPIAKEIEK